MVKMFIRTEDENGLWQEQNSVVSHRLANDIKIAAYTGKTFLCRVYHTRMMILVNGHREDKLKIDNLLRTFKYRRF